MEGFTVCRPYEGLRLRRGEKILVGELLAPHAVVSTCRTNGGFREDVRFVANHQACEPRPCPGEDHARCLAVRDPEGYHRLVCRYHGLPPEETVLLGTAANMNLAGLATESFPLPGTAESLLVFCAATAGVETNAGRAGDPSQVFEWEGSFHPLPAPPGTINLMIFVNQELAPGALVRAVKTATEAKSAVLQELSVPSRYSSGLATGTGTDQIAVAAMRTGRVPLRGAGKHTKLGELLARAVKGAVREALARQNQRLPETIRYVPRLLERFGLGEEDFFTRLAGFLPEPHLTWLRRNRRAVLSDIGLVAAVMAYVHLLDQIAWGVVPGDQAREALARQGAALAVALSGKSDRFPWFLERLGERDDPLDTLLLAVALGFVEKWRVPYFGPGGA